MPARRGNSLRTSGSPPVSRRSRTPIDANSATRRSISSKVRTLARSSHGRPSAGMQYWQRKLQRSVTERRRSPMTRPCPSRKASRCITTEPILRAMPAPPRSRLLVLALTLGIGLAACGRENQEDQVRATLDRFAKATAAKDFQTLCDDLFAAKLVDQVNQALPCELALKNSSLGDAQKPALRVLSVKVDGDKATARVRSSAANQPPSEDTVGLIREDGQWRIISLS